MSVPVSPNQQFAVILEADKSLPAAQQRKFFYNYLTGTQQIEMAGLMDSLDLLAKEADRIKAVFSAAKIGLVGWQNVTDAAGEPLDFDPEKLLDIPMLGVWGATELAHAALNERPSLDDKKKLDSPLPSATPTSAAGAKG